MQAFGTPTTLDVLLTSLVSQLVNSSISLPNGGTLLQEQVRLTLETEDVVDDDPPYDQFITIAPTDFSIDEGAVVGGGNNLMQTNGMFEMTFYSRLETDQVHQDVDSLTNQTLGILVAWRLILKALQLFVPVDGSGNALVCEPIKCRGWKVPKRRAKSAWIRINSTWKMEFVEAL